MLLPTQTDELDGLDVIAGTPLPTVKAAGLKGEPEDYVVIDDNFKRPAEVDLLVGDSSKAKKVLGWEPKVNFEDLVLKMLNHDMKN